MSDEKTTLIELSTGTVIEAKGPVSELDAVIRDGRQDTFVYVEDVNGVTVRVGREHIVYYRDA